MSFNLEELAEKVSIADVIRVVKYIKEYFVLPEGEDKIEYILEGVIRLKRMFELDATDGKITPQVVRLLDYHRCGVADSLVSEDYKDYNRWGLDHLKWYVDRYVDGLSKDEQIAIYTAGYKEFSKVCDLTFERVTNSNKANLIITAASRGNGLGSSGNTLAYAYLPPSRNFAGQLSLVLDLAEIWINNPNKRGILLFNVFNHETGHNLGLSHSNVKTALMAPYYSPNVCCPVKNDDISRLQNLYGAAKQPEPQPEPKPEPTPAPTPTPEGKTRIVIEVEGNITSASIDGYRVNRIQ